MSEATENPNAAAESRLGLRTGVPGVKKGTKDLLPIDPMPEGTTPFKAPETATRREALWLSITPAGRLASRPPSSRAAMTR